MKNRNIFTAIVLIGIVGIGSFWLYNWVLGPTEEASGPIESAPLEVDSAAPAEAANADSGDAQTGLAVYEIDQSVSQVSFTIYEELRGQPKDVLGLSNQVAGQLAVDLSDLTSAQVGEIRVNARTFSTDADRRNQAIRNRILNTDQYEFIVFTPTEIIGLSGNAAPGQSFTFQIAGDLTIRDITQPVNFDVTAQIDANGYLVGSAITVVNRSPYNLVIPNVPGVANVAEEVTLAIDFVAAPVDTG